MLSLVWICSRSAITFSGGGLAVALDDLLLIQYTPISDFIPVPDAP
jgi:hypothetical protein